MRYCRSGWRWQTKRRGGALRWPRNRKFVDSLLEGTGFELLVHGRGEAGCRAFDVNHRGRTMAFAGATGTTKTPT